MVKFGHCHNSMKTCHDSNSIMIILNIIRSICVEVQYVHLVTSSKVSIISPLVTSACFTFKWYYSLKIKVSIFFKPPKLPVNTSL